MTTSPSIAIDATGRELTLRLDDGRSIRLNRFWLRDNGASNGDRASLFRPFRLGTMPDDLRITDATVAPPALHVSFSDGHVEDYELDRLCRGADDKVEATDLRSDVEGPHEIRYDPALAGTSRHHQLLDAVCRRGFAIITGIADDPAATEVIASWLGPIRETDFGRVFDIITEPDPFTPSQSDAALDPHTDDPYRYHPAGVSVLHCVSPCGGAGGVTTIVDGFAVAERIAADDPSAFELLTTVAVPYEHRREASVDQGAAVDLRAAAPVISVDADGDVCGFRFHERSMAPLQLDPDVIDDVYRAVMSVSRHVNGGEFAHHRRLAAGEAVVYDNHRVLHGRTAIDVAAGRRHLRLCTVDRDQVHSRFRRLCAEHAPGTESCKLPSGSAA